MRRILLLYIIFSVIGLTTVHAQFDNGRQRVDENGYDQYGNQVDPAMIPDRLDSANVEVQGLPPKLYMWRINNQLGNRTIIPADTAYHHFQNSNLTEGLTGLPHLLRKRIGENLQIDMVAGTDFPQDLTPYSLVIHCGACMFNRKYVLSRIERVREQHIPMTNFGVAIAFLNGILDQIKY